MAIHITPEMLEATYSLLRLTPPFRGWDLPEADHVEFQVTRQVNLRGEYLYKGGHIIRISARNHGTLHELTRTMAHEVCHLREKQLGVRMDVSHSRTFEKAADSVCKHHLFDRRAF